MRELLFSSLFHFILSGGALIGCFPGVVDCPGDECTIFAGGVENLEAACRDYERLSDMVPEEKQR